MADDNVWNARMSRGRIGALDSNLVIEIAVIKTTLEFQYHTSS